MPIRSHRHPEGAMQMRVIRVNEATCSAAAGSLFGVMHGIDRVVYGGRDEEDIVLGVVDQPRWCVYEGYGVSLMLIAGSDHGFFHDRHALRAAKLKIEPNHGSIQCIRNKDESVASSIVDRHVPWAVDL